MAPKGKKPAKEEKVHEVDKSVPASDVNFKITFDAKHEGGHYVKIKYDWIQAGAPPADGGPQPVEKETLDSGFLKDWQLVQIEGEEPVEVAAEEPVKGGKKAAAPAKGAPKATSALEDITDNRPRIIQYVKNFGEDATPLHITDTVAKWFETNVMKVEIFLINREKPDEEVLKETMELDLSPLLWETKPEGELKWCFDKLQTMELLYLNIAVSSDVPVLNAFQRKKLNPLMVTLVACKGVPYHSEPKYKPVFSYFQFVDGRKFKSLDMPQQSECRFNQKHVFLLGDLDYVKLKEMLATNIVSVELHDNDEYMDDKEDEANAIFSAGKAKFTFRDFLRANCLQLKLRSDVFPLKRDLVDNTQNLDLNTTARKGEQSVEKASPYLVNSTYAIIIANLARPIGPFDQDKELVAYNRSLLPEDAAAEEAPAATPTPDGESRPGTNQDMRKTGQSAFSDRGVTQSKWNAEDAIYERLIIIIPYKSPDMVQRIESSFVKVNLLGLQLESEKYLSTKEFSEEEKKNRGLDFIGGFCLMDNETRMYIFEGIGGEGRGIDMFYKENSRDRPNDRKYTLLYNPDVRFKDRNYTEFNAAIKKIKLRENLRAIMGAPDVYIRSKVPEEMYDILQKFAEIRKLTRLSLVRDFNLFPVPETLLTLERKYGDSLNYEDMHGKPGKQRKKIAVGAENNTMSMASEQSKPISGAFAGAGAGAQPGNTQQTGGAHSSIAGSAAEMGSTAGGMSQKTSQIKVPGGGNEEVVEDETKTVNKRKANTDCKNNEFEFSLKQRAGSPPKDFNSKNRTILAGMSQGRPPQERLNIPEGVDVFQYGNQKLNIWEFQKEQLRQKISQDQTKFYTYSAEHLSLAFPIVNENEIKQKEKELNEAAWKTKAGFDNVMKRENWNLHPKRPHESMLKDLRSPIHIQRAETKAQMKGFQYVPGANGKPDFQSKVKSQEATFSNRDYFKTVFISGDDMVKELAEEKQKEIDDFKKKVVVDSLNFNVNTMEKKKVAQLDRFKNIRENDIKKIGLRHNKTRIGQMVDRQIFVTKGLEDAPISMLKEEEFKLCGYRPPYKQFNEISATSNKDMDTNVHTNFDKSLPRSRKVFIQGVLNNEKTGPKWGGNGRSSSAIQV